MADGFPDQEPVEETALLGADSDLTRPAKPEDLSPNYHDKNIIFTILVYCFHQMYDFLPVGPHLFLYERSICWRYYSEHDPSVIGPGGSVPETLCKIAPVQTHLATIRGWKPLFSAIPVFLVAVPYGRVADKYGKKRVATLSLLGLILGESWNITAVSFPHIFPIETTWLQGLFAFIGGGDTQAASMAYLIGSDLVEEHQRSALFYTMYCVYLATELVGPLIASMTMEISPYIPLALCLGCLVAALGILQFINEPKHEPRQPEDTAESSSVDGGDDTHSRKQGLLVLLRQKNVLLLLAGFVVTYLRPATMFMLQQYASVRFHWNISKTPLFTTEAAAVNILLFLIIVPRLTKYIRTRFGTPQNVIDISIVRISLILLTTGALLTGLSPSGGLVIASVAVFTAGFGLRISLMASITSLAEKGVRARLFGAIQVVENVGILSVFPLTQNLWLFALRLGPPWLGFPFAVISALFGTALICTLFVNSTQRLR